MIVRRRVLLAGGMGLRVAQRLVHGQPAAPVRRVGLLSFSSEAANARVRAAFRQGKNGP